MYERYAELHIILLCSPLNEGYMSNVKEKMKEVIQSQPEDASYEEIMRELAFERMVELGLEDSRSGCVISNEDMEHRIRSCQE